MELVNLLPDEIKRIIFEYDSTYKDIFNRIIETIPDTVMMYRSTKTKKDKYGWSKIKAIFKLRHQVPRGSIWQSLLDQSLGGEVINIYSRSNSIIGLIEKKIIDFYGYNFKCKWQSDWDYRCYNGRSLYSKYYRYCNIIIHVHIIMGFEFQKYAAKSYISDKHLRKKMKRGRYMDMGHYQRRKV
tara:strand:- start:53 stop:604 length:552 start_codon:yes stop_codon:yes gene_type:complete